MTRGRELLDELRAADAVIAACWDHWDTLLYSNRATGIPAVDRDAWYSELTAAQAARQAIAQQTWAWFEGPSASAEEKAAWTIWSPAWQHGRSRR